MTPTLERDDKRSALDAFAVATSNPATALAPAAGPALMATTDRVYGAQAVAVKRDEVRVLQKLAALGAAAGENWYYRYPVKKKGGGTDWIEGPSIKLANDVARIYGNCDIDTRVIDLGDSWLIYARFTDFESGYAQTRPFQQRKSQTSIRADSDRALDIAFQIGVSKAIRNVVVNSLQTYADYAFDAAYNSLVEKIGKELERYRTRTLAGIANMDVELGRVEKALGRAAKDWTAPDVARVIAMMKAIADGMATVEETFPTLDEGSAAPAAPAALDQFVQKEAAGKKRKPAAEPAPAPESEAAPEQTPAPEATAPKNAAEYAGYAQMTIAETADADALMAWWRGGEQRALRNACGLVKEDFAALQASIEQRIRELAGQI